MSEAAGPSACAVGGLADGLACALEFSAAAGAVVAGGVDGVASVTGAEGGEGCAAVEAGADSVAALAEGLAVGVPGTVAGGGLACWTTGGEAVAAGDVSCAQSAPPPSSDSATVAVASLDLFENIAIRWAMAPSSVPIHKLWDPIGYTLLSMSSLKSFLRQSHP